MNRYFRQAKQYSHQTAKVEGARVAVDLNLYKLFTEQCVNLLKPGGRCGIVIPSGVYTDLGAKGLRGLLFEKTKIEGLFCFENRKEIFEEVHRSFKFVVLTFEKSAAPRLAAVVARATSAPPDDLLAPTRMGDLATRSFPAAFMRHDVAELARFPDQGATQIPVELVKRLSPDAWTIPEIKDGREMALVEKVFKFPAIGHVAGWRIKFGRELHMTDDGGLFANGASRGLVPLFEGKMIHQFNNSFASPRYWVARKLALEKLARGEVAQNVNTYRIAYRSIASSTNERTLIATVLPPGFITGHSLNVTKSAHTGQDLLRAVAVLNSFVFDYLIRLQVSANLTVFFLTQTPAPPLDHSSALLKSISPLAARLICTAPEFDELAKHGGLTDHTEGATDPIERTRLRAELDGLIAHLYGLTEGDFTHILGAFPLVDEAVKADALAAFRDVAAGKIL